MKSNRIDTRNISLAVAFVLAGAVLSAQAQTTAPQPPIQDPAATQATKILNPQTELNLTPDQIKQWRALNQELRQQEIDGRARVAQAKLAYTEALDAPNPNEELIKQRAKELADAQSAMTQLQALRQARTLQMLTPEQRIKLKEIKKHNQEAQALIRQQQIQNGGAQRPLQNQNGAGPRQQLKRPNAQALTPAQRKALRQQQTQKPKR
jgi:Spy/CpxP family protein refolding chaperone